MKLKPLLLIAALVIATFCAAHPALAITQRIIVSGNTGGSPCSEVLMYDLDGTLIPDAFPNPFGAEATHEYHDVIAGLPGDTGVYVVSFKHQQVYRFNADGTFDGAVITDEGNLPVNPLDAEWMPDGNLIVSSESAGVNVYNPSTGAWVREFTPNVIRGGMAIGDDGVVYGIAGPSQKVIDYYAPDGTYTGTYASGFEMAMHMHFVGSDLYVVDRGLSGGTWEATDGIVWKVDSEGAVTTFIDDEVLQNPLDFLITPDGGSMLICDYYPNQKIREYDLATGAYIGDWATLPSSPGVYYPTGIALWQDSYIPGDANGDSVVDDADAVILSQNWLASDALWMHGDFNGDGTVNDIDATILATNWQQATSASVPEPSVCILLLGALVGVTLLRRR